MSTLDVGLKSKFAMPGTNEYDKYVDYINRDDAKRDLIKIMPLKSFTLRWKKKMESCFPVIWIT